MNEKKEEIKRHIASAVNDLLKVSRVVFVSGARQVGKTTLVKQIVEEKNGSYSSLDNDVTLNLALTDTEAFLADIMQHRPAVIDEVQRAPNLLRAIKMAVDEDPTPGKFLLTGSTHLFSARGIDESLAGRMELLEMHPLSRGEINGKRETFVDALFADKPETTTEALEKLGEHATLVYRQSLAEMVAAGGFPEPLQRTLKRASWFTSYANAIISRDLRELSQAMRPQELGRLLTLLAHRSTGLENLADISRNLNISDSTLRRYLAQLEAAWLYQPLLPWHRNIGKRLVKSRKIHLIDSGLACARLNLSGNRLAEMGNPQLGPLLESFVVGELRKQISWAEQNITPYHFRTHDKLEVDLVLEDARGRVAGVEVKASTNLSSADFKGLKALAEATGDDFVAGIVLYTGKSRVPFHKRMAALPISAIWA